MGRDLLEAALRVLNACSSGNPPEAADINKLRESAVGHDGDLAPDVLAARMIQREIERGRTRRRAAAQGAQADERPGSAFAQGVRRLLD